METVAVEALGKYPRAYHDNLDSEKLPKKGASLLPLDAAASAIVAAAVVVVFL